MSEQPRSYHFDPANFAAVRRGMLARLALAGPLFMGGIWYFDKYFRAQRDRFDFIFLPLIFVYVSYRVIAMEKEKWDSIVLDFCSDRLLRRLPHYPDLEVRREEVTTIRQSSRGLTIKTVSRPKALFVSSGLVDYDDFRNRLFAWVPMAKVVASRDSFASNCLRVLFCFVLAFGLFGTPLYVMYTTHRALIIPLSLASSLGILGMIVYSRRSPHLPISSRNTIWILLVLPLAIMIARIWK